MSTEMPIRQVRSKVSRARTGGMQERVVYLSGPITGHTPDEATEWRRYVSSRLAPGIVAIDPTRDAAVFSSPANRQLADTARLLNLLHGKEILERNRQDLAR